ncbi:type I DNA topoisomerase [Mycoplasmopsis meleagridis]|nr:type I DNA topoisomerase [Mycoplasmopsis meleagridis]
MLKRFFCGILIFMSDKLVIVESPNKVETIKKYLGDQYDVMASVGHIMKLSTVGTMGLGIDLENWEPKYVIDSEKKEIVNGLKKASKKAKIVYIATDPDREGESIGEHLVNNLKIKNKYYRIKYNEITSEAIHNAINNPKKIDENLVNAQKTRRMLDRIIGFRLSNLMKYKLSNSPKNPSAGRVQSIALKLIVDRENEITSFKPIEYFKVDALLKNNNQEIKAHIYMPNHEADKKSWIFNDELTYIRGELEKEPTKEIIVENIKVSTRKNNLISPFKQAVLYKKSPYSAVVTQNAAQKLYEGYGDGGLISYPRTDSTRLSEVFINNARKYIENKFGKEYILDEIKGFSGDQDAHEAIRPTDISLTPNEAKEKYALNDYEYKIYKLIYENTLKALISPPVKEIKNYTFKKNDLIFKISTSQTTFKGYYVIKDDNDDENEDEINTVLDYKIGEKVKVIDFEISNHFTKPPARYSEGALIEALDIIKVGRPSTFASTIKIVIEREYANNIDGYLHPTEFGTVVLDKLLKGFPKIINESYTAKVEDELDKIAENKQDYKEVMNDFWFRFNKSYNEANDLLEKTAITTNILDEKCPLDGGDLGGDLLERSSKFGRFFGCSNYPECNYIRPKYSDKTCVKDNGRLVLKKSKYGEFFACENYPECNYVVNLTKKKKRKISG